MPSRVFVSCIIDGMLRVISIKFTLMAVAVEMTFTTTGMNVQLIDEHRAHGYEVLHRHGLRDIVLMEV